MTLIDSSLYCMPKTSTFRRLKRNYNKVIIISSEEPGSYSTETENVGYSAAEAQRSLFPTQNEQLRSF